MKKLCKIELFFIAISLLITYKVTTNYVYHFEYVSFPKTNDQHEYLLNKQNHSPKNILILNTEEYFIGGGEVHT